MVEEHNKLYEAGEVTWDMEQNHFSDLTEEERLRYHDAKRPHNLPDNSQHLKNLHVDMKNVPDSWDWREKGAVNPIKDRLECGASWLFSSMAAMEFQYWNLTKNLVSFSEQQLLNCNGAVDCYTCGWMTRAYDYAMRDRIENSTAYPFSGRLKRCTHKTSAGLVVPVVGYQEVNSGDEELAKKLVYEIGVLSHTVFGTYRMYAYRSGVYQETTCPPGSRGNHAMAIVGYGTDPKAGDYWIIRNCWGTDWGDGGYIKWARNKGNMCGVVSFTNYPVLGKV
ncbi:hypothetical protein Ciccas_014270 [Cichlidogyrus casuarinus]|uniref:Peptidase C1A papain C-terminal domain-containing protein n=1 Tax=Cichlidogyrus casuarinus TaxID=1844966 RepID=A0ABD2PIM5_9PLAT